MVTITYEKFELINLYTVTIVKVRKFLLAKEPAFKYGQPLTGRLEYCKHPDSFL